MMDEKTKMAVALKRFSLISPILNGQVERIGEYTREVTASEIEMPHYGMRQYSPKTIEAWYADYIKGGIDALKPKLRSDIGAARVLTPEMADSILRKMSEHPKAPATVVYGLLIEEGAFLTSDVSLPTVRRFIRNNRGSAETGEGQKELLRFAMEHANDMWQADLMYGPYVKLPNGKKHTTYLLAYIDDATRLICYARFYLSQGTESLRDSFREAVLRRGIPKILYSDNGSIYRCQAFSYLCAGIGVTLLHHSVRAANAKGKIERFFRTVRARFLSRLKDEDLADAETLNKKFAAWLDEDYQRKPHEGLGGACPLDVFLAQSQYIVFVDNLARFNEKFMVRVKRTIKKDATISLSGNLYETDMALCGMRVDAHYDPDAPGGIRELFLFKDGNPVGAAKLVDPVANSKRKRRGGPAAGGLAHGSLAGETNDADDAPRAKKTNTISYAEMKEREA
jgi:transposase InsO family protein